MHSTRKVVMAGIRAAVRRRRRIRAEARRWDNADSFEALCELTASWLQGDLIYNPGYGGKSVTWETRPFVAALAAANRAGFLTYTSNAAQSGAFDCGLPWRRRATVCGWIYDAALVEQLRNACAWNGLWMVTDPHGHGTNDIDVLVEYEINGNPAYGRDADAVCAAGKYDTWLPPRLKPHPETDAVFPGATWVEIVDPDLDSGQQLWDVLQAVVSTHTSSPSRRDVAAQPHAA